jgi:hypothetical protein
MQTTNTRYTLNISPDYTPPHPRTDWDNFGSMVCWHRRYTLGDEHDFETPRDFLAGLIQSNFTDAEIVDFVRSGHARGLTLAYNVALNVWVCNEYKAREGDWDVAFTYSAPDDPDMLESIATDLLEYMSNTSLMELVRKRYLIIPLYLYDHSGLSIATTDFHDQWDSGQVGWIYASHDDIKREFGSDLNSMERAQACLEGEVKTYDLYMGGWCYAFELYENDELLESCGGLFGYPEEVKTAILADLGIREDEVEIIE